MGECDMDEEAALAKIKQAHLSPSRNKRLQRIHEAYQLVVHKQAEIEKAMKGSDLVKKITTLRKELAVLETKCQSLEHDYRDFAFEECDMDDEAALAKIKQAHLSPSRN